MPCDFARTSLRPLQHSSSTQTLPPPNPTQPPSVPTSRGAVAKAGRLARGGAGRADKLQGVNLYIARPAPRSENRAGVPCRSTTTQKGERVGDEEERVPLLLRADAAELWEDGMISEELLRRKGDDARSQSKNSPIGLPYIPMIVEWR